MGIPKKRTRKIVVDGRAYRWRLLPSRDDPEDWSYPPPHVLHSGLMLQAEDCPSNGRACRLSVRWTKGRAVTPEMVAKLVREALGLGWDPDARGGPFDSPREFDLDLIETKANLVAAVMGS